MRERLTLLAQRTGPPLVTGLVLGLIGPFGTFQTLPTGTRLGYWLAVVSANWLLMDLILRRLDMLAGPALPAPRLLLPLLGACLAALPATGIVVLANGLTGIGWPQNVPVLFAQVLLLLAAIAVPAHMFESMREQAAARAEPPDAVHPQANGARSAPLRTGLSLFTSRLSGPLEGRLLCLEMQDHYLVVHHSNGSEMVLCRMEDAARELEALGQRVHRSWWVAADAVSSVEREGQRLYLRLDDERRVPVGRSYRAALKASGWI